MSLMLSLPRPTTKSKSPQRCAPFPAKTLAATTRSPTPTGSRKSPAPLSLPRVSSLEASFSDSSLGTSNDSLRLTSTPLHEEQLMRDVCPKALDSIKKSPKNMSPFKSDAFYPMLQASTAQDKVRMSLAVDIDETLVRARSYSGAALKQANAAGLVAGCDYSVRLDAGSAREELIVVKFRPHVHEFLRFVAERFEVIIFTASQRSYADPLMDALDPQHKMMHRHLRLYREHCADCNGAKVKDLALLGRPLDRIALLDNTPASFMFQPRNGIPITSWFGAPDDTELLQLMPMLDALSRAATVYDVLDLHKARVRPEKRL